jgi:S-adenosylmethionine hydrolase
MGKNCGNCESSSSSSSSDVPVLKVTGSYAGKGKVTQVDKYGNVTCECVCVVLKVLKTCNKDSYLVSVTVGDRQNAALVVQHENNEWFGVGQGVTQYVNFNSTNNAVTSVNYKFSSYVDGNNERWASGNVVLTPCKRKHVKKSCCDC